jgi:hypothetical protein
MHRLKIDKPLFRRILSRCRIQNLPIIKTGLQSRKSVNAQFESFNGYFVLINGTSLPERIAALDYRSILRTPLGSCYPKGFNTFYFVINYTVMIDLTRRSFYKMSIGAAGSETRGHDNTTIQE